MHACACLVNVRVGDHAGLRIADKVVACCNDSGKQHEGTIVSNNNDGTYTVKVNAPACLHSGRSAQNAVPCVAMCARLPPTAASAPALRAACTHAMRRALKHEHGMLLHVERALAANDTVRIFGAHAAKV